MGSVMATSPLTLTLSQIAIQYPQVRAVGSQDPEKQLLPASRGANLTPCPPGDLGFSMVDRTSHLSPLPSPARRGERKRTLVPPSLLGKVASVKETRRRRGAKGLGQASPLPPLPERPTVPQAAGPTGENGQG